MPSPDTDYFRTHADASDGDASGDIAADVEALALEVFDAFGAADEADVEDVDPEAFGADVVDAIPDATLDEVSISASALQNLATAGVKYRQLLNRVEGLDAETAALLTGDDAADDEVTANTTPGTRRGSVSADAESVEFGSPPRPSDVTAATVDHSDAPAPGRSAYDERTGDSGD